MSIRLPVIDDYPKTDGGAPLGSTGAWLEEQIRKLLAGRTSGRTRDKALMTAKKLAELPAETRKSLAQERLMEESVVEDEK